MIEADRKKSVGVYDKVRKGRMGDEKVAVGGTNAVTGSEVKDGSIRSCGKVKTEPHTEKLCYCWGSFPDSFFHQTGSDTGGPHNCGLLKLLFQGRVEEDPW